ncbi:MAG TPA: DUF2269 family protein [Longimicrobium sp.]|jgi:uncharacterized membrane protein|nr:DUF2269 family protein [Longimicrobium sp.]
MSLPILLELVHVFSVFWFLGGLLGRAVALSQARRATELRDLEAIMRVSSVFELRMVRPGSMVLLAAGLLTAVLKGWPVLGPLRGTPPYWVFASLVLFLSAFTLIPLVFLPRGKVYRAALDDAREQGTVTPRLTAALGDRAVAMGHAWEWIVIVLITVLMVAKPF